jgi:uncharacterized membrane protein
MATATKLVPKRKLARMAFRRIANALPKTLSVQRELPIQRSVDVAVPIDVAWDEWMRFEHLPEGTHRVQDVERDGDRLTGHVRGSDWEAEIVDERIDESFAWHSVGGSDCSGLLTFHELSDRLTRMELHVDVIPGGVTDSVELLLHVADRRAEAELRRFKAYVESLDPDQYPPAEREADGDQE